MAADVRSRPTGLIVGAVVAAAVVVVVVIALASRGSDTNNGGGRRSAAPPTSEVKRATGPGTCAFLSVDDVRAATGAGTVELRQSLGPNGLPGCEWSLDDPTKVVQLEFEIGAGPPVTMPAAGEDAAGPWSLGRWVGSTRTLYVEVKGTIMLTRVTEADTAKARDIATKVATLAAART